MHTSHFLVLFFPPPLPLSVYVGLSRNSSAANLGISRHEHESGASVKFHDTVEEILKREDRWNRACDKCCTAINYRVLTSRASLFYSAQSACACIRTDVLPITWRDASRQKWGNESENLLDLHPAVPLSLACTSSRILSEYIKSVYADASRNQSVDWWHARAFPYPFLPGSPLSLSLSLSLSLFIHQRESGKRKR